MTTASASKNPHAAGVHYHSVYRYGTIFGLLALSLGGAAWYRSMAADLPPTTTPDGRPVYYWFCSQCGYESVCNPGDETETVPCPNCGPPTRLRALFAPHSWKLRFLTAYDGWLAKAVLLIPGLAGVILLLVSGKRQPLAAHTPEDWFTFSCRSCGHQVRRRHQDVDQVICPRCKYVIADRRGPSTTTVPELDEDDELTLWWRQVRIKRRKRTE